MTQRQISPVELAKKRVQAQHMILVNGLLQKEVANRIGISEKTIGKWIKRYGWNTKGGAAIRKAGGLNIVMDEFFKEIEATEGPIMRGKIKQLWIDFTARIEQEIGKSKEV